MYMKVLKHILNLKPFCDTKCAMSVYHSRQSQKSTLLCPDHAPYSCNPLQALQSMLAMPCISEPSLVSEAQLSGVHCAGRFLGGEPFSFKGG